VTPDVSARQGSIDAREGRNAFDARGSVQYNEPVFAFAKAWMDPPPTSLGATAISTPGARADANVTLDAVSLTLRAKQGSIEILQTVSLRIAAGEFVCLLGPSGSGKSTILNLVAGLVRPTEGHVLYRGAEVTSPGPDRAMVFQDSALFPWLALRGNVEFPLKLQGLPRAARAARSEELLRLVHLWRFADRYPHELS